MSQFIEFVLIPGHMSKMSNSPQYNAVLLNFQGKFMSAMGENNMLELLLQCIVATSTEVMVLWYQNGSLQ